MKNIISICVVVFCSASCDAIIEVEDISGSEVDILAPKNGVALNEGAIKFNWSAIEDVEAYTLQIATPNFENAQQIIADSSLTGVSFIKTLSAGDFEWRIRAENSGYVTAFTNSTFTIEE